MYLDHIRPPLIPSSNPDSPTLSPAQHRVLLFVVNNNLLSPVNASHMCVGVRLGHGQHTTSHIPKEE